jgi:integrase
VPVHVAAWVEFKTRSFEPQTVKQQKELSERHLDRQRAWAMVKRRAKQAGIETPGIGNHTFRGTGITAYLENPEAKLEHAQQIAAHSDPNTTRLYDRRSDEVSMDEVERIGIAAMRPACRGCLPIGRI